MARSTAGALVGSFAEAIAKMIESFGTFAVVAVVAVVVGSYTRSWPWAVGIGVFGLVGSSLSLYYRSREALNRSLDTVGTPSKQPSSRGHGNVLEADLTLPDEIAKKAEWLGSEGFERGASSGNPRSADG